MDADIIYILAVRVTVFMRKWFKNRYSYNKTTKQMRINFLFIADFLSSSC